MDLLITFAAFFVLALFIRAAAGTSSGETYPYDRHTYLLSKAERSFIGVLEQAAPQHTRIFSKVRMADVICVRKGTRNPLRFFNRISAKHFDFVLCDARSSELIAVIELDDSSHRSNRSRRTDEFKNNAAEAAGVPLIRTSPLIWKPLLSALTFSACASILSCSKSMSATPPASCSRAFRLASSRAILRREPFNKAHLTEGP